MAGLVTKRFADFITFLNLIFGSLAIMHTMNTNYKAAAIFILLAVVMDGMDGKVARKFESSSDFGRELDSLCDMVSFGVAPAILLYSQVLLSAYSYLGMAIALLFIACGAYRLARFNVMNVGGYFLGLPITIAGGLLALVSLSAAFLTPLIILIITAALGLFMISTMRIPKL